MILRLHLQVTHLKGAKDNMVEFGEQLRRAREKKGMTQQTLAEQLFVTRQTVSRWECGDRFPDILTTKKLSEVLDVSLDDLLSGKDMSKVVERNPVVENKTVNNIMIFLYAVVIFSLLSTFFDFIWLQDWTYLTKWALRCNDGLYILQVITEILCYVIGIAVFSYGFIQAISGTLSPKRTGIVISIFFCTKFIECVYKLIESFSPRVSGGSFISRTCYYFLPAAIGFGAAYLFFIRNNKSIVWPVLFTGVSTWEIICAVKWIVVLVDSKLTSIGIQGRFEDTKFHDALGYRDKMAIFMIVLRELPTILISCLMIYQVIVLYIKRKNAEGIIEEVNI